MDKTYKHYVEFYEKSPFISVGWSSGEQPRRKTNNAVCVLEDEVKEFHLTPGGEIHPVVIDAGTGVPMYKYENGEVTKLDDETVLRLAERFNAADAAAQRIAELNKSLADTDYIDNKIVELGEPMREKYADKIAQRQAWREEINAQQKIIAARFDV